ncbi:MAG: hypothetical protein NXH75_14270 [Halobacteriovoraceae bacterium]|nr:hypothetical protein [Halobacteriovoraceae bacterium]
MKRDEDDLITQLLDETYEVTSHPGKDLCSSKTGNLSDHFERMASQQADDGFSPRNPLGKIMFLDSFIRLEVKGESLDIPNILSPFSRVISPSSEQVYEIKDETFKSVFQSFVGVPVDQFEIDEDSGIHPKEPNLDFQEIKKKFAA